LQSDYFMVMSSYGSKCSPNRSSQGNGAEEAFDSMEPGAKRHDHH
jgi:hypothetical protein